MATRDFLESRLREPLPENPKSMESLLEIVKQEVLGNITHMDRPRCFAYVPGPNSFVSVMADALASGFNVFAGSWLEASGPAMIELVVIDWIRQLCGLPEHAGGLLVGGGSIANLMAIDIARQALGGFRPDRPGSAQPTRYPLPHRSARASSAHRLPNPQPTAYGPATPRRRPRPPSPQTPSPWRRYNH